jgi:hypothetical protein
MDLNKHVVKSAGLIDVEATLTAIAAACNAANEVYSNDAEKVGEAVSAVFDQYRGAFIQGDALRTIVVGKLNLTSLEAINAMGERVLEFVEANSQGDSSTYEVRKGRGIGRRADVPAKGAKPATA